MTYESRVLAVLPARGVLNQGQVVRAARMDGVQCRLALLRLMDLGVVERTIYRSGRDGRPAYHYRRVVRTEAA